MLQPVQRTLIVTHGAIARQAGQRFEELLAVRGGPEAVVAVVHTSVTAEPVPVTAGPSPAAVAERPLVTGFQASAQEPAQEGEPLPDSFRKAVQVALTHISPTNISSRLAEQGYALEQAQEIALFLLVDVSATGGEQAVHLATAVSAVIQDYLGVEAASLLIWLAASDETMQERSRLEDLQQNGWSQVVANCLVVSEANHHLFGRGILSLSPLNETGLRLADATALADVCADCLWSFAASPLRMALAWLTDRAGGRALGSMGLGHWEWDVEGVRNCLQQHWLTEVIAQWMAPAPTLPSTAEVAHWVADTHLTPQAIKSHTLTLVEQQPPRYEEAVWYEPWPWEVADLFADLNAADAGDQEGQTQRVEWADLRLQEPLCVATQAIRQQLQSILDTRPVGGLAYADQWVATLLQELDRLRGDLLVEADEQSQADAALATVRGELEAQRRALLASWPASGFFAWVRLTFRPWYWPRLAWHYRRLRSIGRQLVLVCHHQALRRRQQAMTAATLHAYVELEQIARHYRRQVEEIGDMLDYLRREKGEMRKEKEEIPPSSPFSLLPSLLWSRLVDDPKIEAEVAAKAIGGLGQQLVALDDAILTLLQATAADRLVGLEDYSAVTVLQLLYPTTEAFSQWWQGFWEQATPLWRYDPAQLPEQVRTQETTFACLCGLEASTLMASQQEAHPQGIHCLESVDKQRLFLLRLRSGLTAAAMTK